MKTLQERVKAQDPKLTVKQLDKLSRSRDFRVRMAVAKHPNTSELVLFNLVNDKTVSVYKALAPRISAIIDSKKEIVAQCMRDGLLEVSISNPANISVYNYTQEDLSPEMSTVDTMILRDSALDIESVVDNQKYPDASDTEYPLQKNDCLGSNHQKISTWALRLLFVLMGVILAEYFISGGY